MGERNRGREAEAETDKQTYIQIELQRQIAKTETDRKTYRQNNTDRDFKVVGNAKKSVCNPENMI